MKNIRLHLLLFLTITICKPIFGQQFSILHYTVSDGLPSNQITSFYEDSYGFLWIGTNNGVSRFNGKNFVNYGYTEGLQDLFINTIYEDSHHRLWVGTIKGISQIKGNSFITCHIKNKTGLFVFGFDEINNELWANTENGVYRFDDSIWIPADISSGNDVSSAISADDGIYLNYGNKLLFKSKNALLTIAKIEANSEDDYFSDLSEFNNRIFINTRTCLYEVVHHRLELLIDNIPAHRIFWYYVDKDNNYWLLIENKGLYRYQLFPGKKEKISFVYNIPNADGFPFADSHGNLWVTSYNGLLRLQPKNFHEIYVTPKKTLKRSYITSVGNNQLLIFEAGGPKYYNNEQIKNVPLPSCYKNLNGYLQDVIEGDAKDSNNNTWFITRFRKIFYWNGISLKDFSNLLPLQHEEYISNLTVNPVTNQVFLCGDTTVIAGNEKKFETYHDKYGKTFSKSSWVLFTHTGIGIVKVLSKGVYFITKQNEIIKAPHELDIIDKGIGTYFFEDKKGCIWVSNAGKGLIKFSITDDYKIKDLLQLNTENGLPDNKIISIAFDTRQNAWINTYKDVAVLQNINNNFSALDVFIIGWGQGIMHELSLASQLSADNAGNIYVPAIDKVFQFNIDSLQLKKVIPKIVVEKIMLNMQETNWALHKDSTYSYFHVPYKPIFGYSENSLGIKFEGTCLTDASNIEYSYRLQPIDTTWSAPSPNNVVSFLKLASENYTFQVKARASNSMWSDVVSYSFIIRKPFWETWLFRILIIIVALFIIISIFRTRIKKIRHDAFIQNQLRELEMKALKAQMNPHFIFNCLNSINRFIIKNDADKAADYLTKFAKLIRIVLEQSGKSFVPLEDEICWLKLYMDLEALRFEIPFQYEINCNGIDTLSVMIPTLLIQPFVENAIWHGLHPKNNGCGKILITMHQHDNVLQCTICDNGIGVTNSNSKEIINSDKKSLGIKLTQQRLQLVSNNKNEDIKIELQAFKNDSGENAGTCVHINIPVKTI